MSFSWLLPGQAGQSMIIVAMITVTVIAALMIAVSMTVVSKVVGNNSQLQKLSYHGRS